VPVQTTEKHSGQSARTGRRQPLERPVSALALPVISLGYLMVIVDSTAVNVALPAIGRGFRGDVTWLQWVVDGYTLSFAGLLLTGGALAERLGGRRVFGAGLALFTAASAACGLAPGLPVWWQRGWHRVPALRCRCPRPWYCSRPV
jgi:MFS family permease